MANIEFEMTMILTDPEIWAAYWFSKNDNKTLNNFVLDYNKELRALNIRLYQLDKKPLKPINIQLLTCAFEAHLDKLPIERRAKAKDSFKCDQENLEPLKQWIKAVTGKVSADDLYVMAHWIWLVKRRLQEQAVVYHIMPIVISPKQGGGKSTAVRKLYSPMEQLTIELRIKQAVDERAYTLFSNYLIGFFDEMAGAEKVDVNDIKSTLSSETLSYRPMRTNAQVKLRNLCSFIGTSNNQLSDMIRDTTGVRRFFPIFALDKLDHELINKIDYKQLWLGVDERLERGYFERVKTEVDAKQANMQVKDELQLFVEDRFLIPKSNDDVREVSGKKLYTEYQKYIAEAGLKYPLAAQTFYRKLQDLGIVAEKRRDENKAKTWFFNLSKEAVFTYAKDLQ